MTTENGLPLARHMRSHIELLRRRLDFLADRLAATILERPEGDPDRFYDAQEIRALQWAIPVLEAEWDNATRMRENIIAIDMRLESLERSGVEPDAFHSHRWTLESGEQVKA